MTRSWWDRAAEPGPVQNLGCAFAQRPLPGGHRADPEHRLDGADSRRNSRFARLECCYAAPSSRLRAGPSSPNQRQAGAGRAALHHQTSGPTAGSRHLIRCAWRCCNGLPAAQRDDDFCVHRICVPTYAGSCHWDDPSSPLARETWTQRPRGVTTPQSPQPQTAATISPRAKLACCRFGLPAAISIESDLARDAAPLERTSHADPQQPRLPVGPGDAALRRRRRDGRPPPLAANP